MCSSDLLDAIVEQYQDLYTRVYDEHCNRRPARGFRSAARKLAEPVAPTDGRR